FHINSHDELDQFLTSISLPRMHYMEGATPRTELKEKVYTSTEYPAEQSIALHNELNYVITWPMKIFFACAIPAREGGATPIADVRKVYDLIDPDIRARFIDKGWMLLRNFGEGLSLPWQTSFRMSSKSEFTSYCRESRITCEWKDENRVRTRQVRPAVRRHPKTAEPVWFNHIAFWHISSLAPEVREMFLKEFKEDDLPYNTYYGDGTPIEDSVVEHIREAYDRATIAFPWQRGDLLMIDNMLVAHGRKPFTGERKVLTAMGEPFSDKSSWNWSAAGFSGGSTL
ncbi:MAG TPA: TauD/TfdA family dioxygenase, partial [Blastocatellia bacterium]